MSIDKIIADMQTLRESMETNKADIRNLRLSGNRLIEYLENTALLMAELEHQKSFLTEELAKRDDISDQS